MKAANSFCAEVFVTAVLLSFLSGGFLLCLVSDAWCDTVAIGGHEYVYVGDRWYGYRDGRKTDEIEPSRLVVRLKDRGEMNSFPFTDFDIRDVRLVGRRYLNGFYVIGIGSGEDPFEVAATLDQTGLFDVVEFDAYGEVLATPQDSLFGSQWNLAE